LRTIEWDAERKQVKMIDQRLLPGRLSYIYCQSGEQVSHAIKTMAIRGAPALGVAGAFGVALAMLELSQKRPVDWYEKLLSSCKSLEESRPTAVNLAWGVNRVLSLINPQHSDLEGAARIALEEASRIAEEDVATNMQLAINGSALIDDGDTIIHHCNTGALAGVDWGTAFGAIRFAHEQGKRVHVLVDETRPRLQGARLTAWECEQYGIPYEIITDNAAGYYLRNGRVQKVFFGADRVTANGDVVNKVGTYMLSLAAQANKIPVVCVFPITSVDLSVDNGDEVEIEERPMDEVLSLEMNGVKIAPANAKARNPAFDVTPFQLITAWVTDKGIIRSQFSQIIKRYVYNKPSDGK
jgi:methylthioribose-1-phosphate isomerase